MYRPILSLLVTTLPLVALAGDTSVDIGKIEGTYRKHFQNGDSSGAKYTSTDVLQIVQVEKGVAYFSVELHFFNGHMCELSGIAASEKGELIYREDDEQRRDEPCVLHLVSKRGRITFEDIHQHCRRNCGARGAFDDASFRIAGRTTTGLKRLRASPGYRAAVEEYRKSKKEKP
jgi:hypothetical protein